MSIVDSFDRTLRNKNCSYKMVTILALLDNLVKGTAPFDRVVQSFKRFYIDRVKQGRMPEKNHTVLARVVELNDGEIRATMQKQSLHYMKDFIIRQGDYL